MHIHINLQVDTVKKISKYLLLFQIWSLDIQAEVDTQTQPNNISHHVSCFDQEPRSCMSFMYNPFQVAES